MLFFKSRINGDAVEVDRARVKILDAGEWSIIFEPLINPGRDDRLVLRVPFADGNVPAQALFLLVSHVSEIDTRIDVTRHEQIVDACQAEVRGGVRGPEDFVLLGYLDNKGVPTVAFAEAKDSVHGLQSSDGVAYRGKGWLLFEVWIRNLQGPQPWGPSEATLTGKAGEKLRGRVVTEEQSERVLGEVRVLVVTDELPPSAGLVFSLELRGLDGRGLTFPNVKIPAPAKDPKL